jgi:hypothetical protein
MVKIKISINPTTTIESEGETMQDALRGLGVIFDAITKLSKAGEKIADWTFQYRNPKGYEFYSMARIDGTLELPFGETKEGHKLFPKEVGPPYSGGGSGGGGGGGGDWG